MKLALTAIALSGLVTLGAATDAAAWTRTGSLTTHRGTYTRTAGAGCSDGTCSRTASVTGPSGHTVSRSGEVSRTGPYRAAYSRTTTGPNGGSVTRDGWVRAYPYW